MSHSDVPFHNGMTMTHELYVRAVASLAIARLNADERSVCEAVKLTYGAGPDGVRGITYYSRWKGGNLPVDNAPRPFVCVCATGQESWTQLAGTTIHELAHVLAGCGAGHGPDWHKACERLGLRRVKAAGTSYKRAMFAPDLRLAVAALPLPADGAPVIDLSSLAILGVSPASLRPCQAGIGTRGGKSRGKGSGSRNGLWVCACETPAKVRAARSSGFDATCNKCASPFVCV